MLIEGLLALHQLPSAAEMVADPPEKPMRRGRRISGGQIVDCALHAAMVSLLTSESATRRAHSAATSAPSEASVNMSEPGPRTAR